jgi:hypothetical protein
MKHVNWLGIAVIISEDIMKGFDLNYRVVCVIL